MTEKTTPAPSRQDVEAKRKALETVHAEREDLERQMPRLSAAVTAAREQLEKAHLDELVAARTAGREDDVAAAASVKAAQTALDAACERRDDVEQRLERWIRAEERLTREYGAASAAFLEAHRARAKAALSARIAKNAPAFAAFLRDVTMLEGLDFSWLHPQPESFGHALVKYLPTDVGMPKLIADAKDAAQRIRGGAEVAS